MPELGSVNPVKRMTCPHCGAVLSDEELQEALEGEIVNCSECGKPIRLPREVVERHQQSKYLGTSLDIVG